jgi:hypothetical protein
VSFDWDGRCGAGLTRPSPSAVIPRGELSGEKTLLLRGPLRGRRRVVFPSRWSHLSPMSSGSASGR